MGFNMAILLLCCVTQVGTQASQPATREMNMLQVAVENLAASIR